MKDLFLRKNIFLGLILIISGLFITTITAQDEKSNAISQRQKDQQLANLIREKTNRSSEGLVKKKHPNGGISMDLQGRFQNLVLSRFNSTGEPSTACVTSVEEANLFFGRNLETGEIIPNYFYQKDPLAAVAARHGMSAKEFEFYSKMIEKYYQRNLSSPETATITIVNNDGPGEGFNDTTSVTMDGTNPGTTAGDRRLNLFNFAAGIWGDFLDSGVPIPIDAEFNPLAPCTTMGGVLGFASTNSIFQNHTNAVFPNTWYHISLANKQSGTDNDMVFNDISTTFNSDVDNGCLGVGTRFYYGFDGSTPANRINLLVVVLHELGHGLGFSSFVNGATGQLAGGDPDVYTTFMFDESVSMFWNAMTDGDRMMSALRFDEVAWTGPNINIAGSILTAGRNVTTGNVYLYTPNPLEPGSSISHFSTTANPNLLMEPIITMGLPIDLDLTRQQMRDIGWYRDSDNDLTPDTITNVMPNSGTLNVGTMATATWTNGGGFTRDVIVELSTDGGVTFPTVLGSGVSNPLTGNLMAFNFTVPNMPTTQGRIRVREDNFVAPAGVSQGNFVIQAPTAADASVAGRVLTPSGRGIPRALVGVTDFTGEVRYSRTNQFGYYRFNNLPVGETYTFTVSHKQYRFEPQVLNLDEDLRGFNLIANP